MPVAPKPKPQCHDVAGSMPQPWSMCLNPSPCASQPQTSGENVAPTLMPM